MNINEAGTEKQRVASATRPLLPLNNHSVAGFATFMSLLGREKHFTGILIYKIMIIKIKSWTCDNKTMRKKNLMQ